MARRGPHRRTRAEARRSELEPIVYFISVSGLCLLLDACASTPVAQNPFVAAEATPADTRKPPPAPSGAESSEELMGSVVLLASSPNAITPSLVGKVLRHLAKQLRLLSSPAAVDVDRVAERLEASPVSSLAHGALAKQGLKLVLEALLAQPSVGNGQQEYRKSLQTLADAIRGVRDVAPLNEQRAVLAAAFRAATDGVLLAQRRAPLFQMPVPSPAREPLPVEMEIERARSALLALARVRWSNGRNETSRTLSALADLLVAADSTQILEAQVTELRFQAKRLRRADLPTLGDAAWVKKALNAALSGLARLGARGGVGSSSWSRAAEQAVDGIEERSTITLQRAPVQDALRATIDAFAAELSAQALQP